jgi:hypothetical protein
MHPTSIRREEMMVSGQVKFNATIHTPLLSFEFGQLRYNGKVLREKGDIYLVDSTVTGSDDDTCLLRMLAHAVLQSTPSYHSSWIMFLKRLKPSLG